MRVMSHLPFEGTCAASVSWSCSSPFSFLPQRAGKKFICLSPRSEAVTSVSQNGDFRPALDSKRPSSSGPERRVIHKTAAVVEPFGEEGFGQLCQVIQKSFGERATRLRSNSSLSKKGRSDFLLAETREGGASAKNHVLNVNYFSPDVTSHQSTAVYKNFVNELQDFESEDRAPIESRDPSTRTLYLVDVHPLCYEGKKPRPTAILKWLKLLFDQVTHEDPVIAVMDGERGNDYRRQLLPCYKAKRNKYKPLSGVRGPYYKGDEMDLREAFPQIQAFLAQCNVPVLKIEDAEADDVVATLMHQAVSKGMRVVVASPDMDFRQLLSEKVNMLLPLPEFGRWSFYTLEQYIAQNSCEPSLDLGLRCIMGDSSDNVPGLPDLAPGFGRKTALKLMKKHGSLESLLVAAKTRTVGRPYIQDALTQHADVLYRNLQVLKLRRDVGITLKEEWCRRRDRSRELQAFHMLEKNLMRKS
ncbi:hypothetical protein MPTK1_6g02570 [Marchantia polymorpha subsp. ruderalis]|uniref:5'-3' exonuclease domain-containing protein n=2 Tax=Marchantia polymorpha TaxID=3197 RepID=A0AAF6BMT9_MARPO|nr:hypothetical protein MARPO_0035s0044 [Marchantia polymorpha]BBN13323.1 hypothetical protein Mp_6g02570 [Marchantia polymorpha subsp. ruderalis]|eukprot:PTQ41251.1 hypothetical protein MARPO_0035s0044 [Marchantia polymorpha]